MEDNQNTQDIRKILHGLTMECYNCVLTTLEEYEAEVLKPSKEFTNSFFVGYEHAIWMVKRIIAQSEEREKIKNEQDGQRKEDLGSVDEGDQKPLRSSRADGKPDGGKQPESIL